jgi:hypothetical protein
VSNGIRKFTQLTVAQLLCRYRVSALLARQYGPLLRGECHVGGTIPDHNALVLPWIASLDAPASSGSNNTWPSVERKLPSLLELVACWATVGAATDDPANNTSAIIDASGVSRLRTSAQQMLSHLLRRNCDYDCDARDRIARAWLVNALYTSCATGGVPKAVISGVARELIRWIPRHFATSQGTYKEATPEGLQTSDAIGHSLEDATTTEDVAAIDATKNDSAVSVVTAASSAVLSRAATASSTASAALSRAVWAPALNPQPLTSLPPYVQRLALDEVSYSISGVSSDYCRRFNATGSLSG